MGVLNLTPDSFSDAGHFSTLSGALAQAERMAAEGADMIDLGGESTRPGARPVSENEELDRVLPLVEALRTRYSGVISVDTNKPGVMRAAVAAGADMINDVYALRRADALQTASDLRVPVCLMHMQGDPATMQVRPGYTNVLTEVTGFLRERARACIAAGISASNIFVDPGFGFGKDLKHNLALMRGLRHIAALGYPVLVGVSRKSMIGEITGKPLDQRVYGSVAMAVYAALQGASVVRVHDVGPTVDALRVIGALNQENEDD